MEKQELYDMCKSIIELHKQSYSYFYIINNIYYFYKCKYKK